MAIPNTIIHSVYVQIVNSSGSRVVNDLPVTSVSIQSVLGGIPLCSLSISGGTDAGSSEFTSIQGIREALQKALMTDALKAYIYATVGYMKGTSGVVTNQIDLFRGPVRTVGEDISTSIGGSSVGIRISVMHPFGELMKWAYGSMVYADHETVAVTANVQKLWDKQKAKQDFVMSLYGTAEKIIADVTNTGMKTAVQKAGNASIATMLSNMITQFQEKTVLPIPGSADPMDTSNGVTPVLNLSDYVTGSVTPVQQSVYARALVRNFLIMVAKNILNSDLGSSLIRSCASPEIGLIIAPRSLDKVTLIPDDGWYVKDGSIIPLTSDWHSGMRSDISSTQQSALPDGILVTLQNTDHFYGGSSAFIQGYYPDNMTGAVKYKWLPVPAPSWFNDDAINLAADSTTTVSEDVDQLVYKTLCSNYAKMMYNKLAFQQNTATITTGLHALLAYRALGGIVSVSAHPDYDPSIIGRLTSYSFVYASGQSSNVSVVLGLSHVRPYSSNMVSGDNPVYSMNSSDIITEMPSIEDSVAQGEQIHGTN